MDGLPVFRYAAFRAQGTGINPRILALHQLWLSFHVTANFLEILINEPDEVLNIIIYTPSGKTRSVRMLLFIFRE